MRREVFVLCALCAFSASGGFAPEGVRGDELADQLVAARPLDAVAPIGTAPSLVVEGEEIRVRNAEVVARPFALDAALDDLVASFRVEDDAPDLARFALAHATGDPAPLASVTGSALLVETRPEGSRAVLLRGGLSVLAARHEAGVVVAAWDARTGAPVRGHALVVLGASDVRDGKPRRFSQLGAAPLDDAGMAVVPGDERFTQALVVVRHEDGRAAWSTLALRATPDERPRVSVHWERALLRPGEPARAALIARRVHEGELVRVREGEKVEALLVDETGKELARRDLAVDGYGVAIFEAPSVRGAQRIQARVAGELARVDGPVLLAAEALRPAALDLSLDAPGWVEPGAPFTVVVHARDPLGAPVVGRARWRLAAGTVSEGAVATDGSGTATVALRSGEEPVAHLSVFFADAAGREAAASARVPVSAGPHRFTIATERRFVGPGEDVAIDLDARSLDGRVEDVKGAAYLSKDGVLVARADLVTKDGRSRTPFKIPAPGAWEVAFVATPSHGSLRVFAGDPAAPHLELIPEKAVFHRGEPARFLVRAPQGARVLVVAEDEHGTVRAGTPRLLAAGVFTIDLDATWAPGFSVTALSVIEGKLERIRVRVPTVPVVLPLEIEATADKPVYKANEKPTLRIHAQSSDNLPERRVVLRVSLEDVDAAEAAERAGGREAGLLLARRRDPPTAPPGFMPASTDDAGNAQFQVTLPAEGRWRARILGVAPDGRSATHDLLLVARRRLAIDLGAPSAMEVGDRLELVLAARNESDKAATVELALASSAPALLELQGETKKKLEVPARGTAALHVLAVAKAPGRVKLDAKLSLANEDETASAAVLVTAPRLGWSGATSALVGSDTVAAPGSAVSLLAPEGPKLLVRVDTEAATLGDLVAELVRPGHGVDPAFAFVPALLARRALDARGMAWEAVAKRVGVDPAEPLLAGEPGKGPRDPRRSPLFSKPRLDALARDGLAALEARSGPTGFSWRAGAAPDIESTATAVEALALARDLGVAVAPAALDRGAAALDAYLALPPGAQPPGPGGRSAERAHAALALVLAGKAAPLDKLDQEPPDGEAELLLALARLRAAKDGPEAPKARERARALLEKTPPGDASSAARELELATLLDPAGPLARSLAFEVVLRRPLLAIGEPRVGALLARALAEYVRLSPARKLGGSVTVQGRGELHLREDDPLLVEATLLADSPAPVGTLLVARTAPGAVRVTAGALSFEPQGGSGAAVERTFARVRHDPVVEAGALWSRARFEPLVAGAAAHAGDLVRVELTVKADKAYERFVLEERIPAGFELVSARGTATEALSGSVRFFADLLTPGEHRFTLVLRARLAGEVQALPTRAWTDPRPGYAGRNESATLKVLD